MQVKHRSCFKCKYEIETAETKCARCGRGLRSRAQIRVLGAIMVFLGLFLIGTMGLISAWIYTVIYYPASPNSARFSGSESDLMLIAGVFGFVILFGIVALITRLWQLILGRRNMVLVWIIFILGAIFIIGGNSITYFMK